MLLFLIKRFLRFPLYFIGILAIELVLMVFEVDFEQTLGLEMLVADVALYQTTQGQRLFHL